MDLQFQKTKFPSLQLMKREPRNLEETQELRIPDGMPDIGRVLGAWGQVLLRSKEWRNSSAHVSGGVQTWVLYVPEDGIGMQCIQTWIPFHAKWDLPDTDADGIINVNCLLRSADARNTSSRKMMIRVNVGIQGEMWIPAENSVYTPVDMPEDICLLHRNYSMLVPKETGEKAFVLEEELAVPSADMDTLLYYNLQPEVLERKVMSDKVVFRGTAQLHAVYLGKDSQLHTWDTEIPFSQYSELEREYGTGAMARIIPALTSLETELNQEGRVGLKAGITGQYMICDKMDFDVIEDAYSPQRIVQPQIEQLQIPMLEEMQQIMTAEQKLQTHGTVADITFLQDHPYRLPGSDNVSLGIPGQFQLLYRGEDGMLQHATARWEEQWQVPTDEGAILMATARAGDRPFTAFDGDGMLLSTDIQVDAMVLSGQGIPMVTGMEIDEITQPDPARPSLILRKAGKDSLWELAKKTGSTVERIQEINHLDSEPNPEQMLLIPVL